MKHASLPRSLRAQRKALDCHGHSEEAPRTDVSLAEAAPWQACVAPPRGV